MSKLDRREVVEALDQTPRSVTGLARSLGAGEDAVQEALRQAQDEGLVVDWGGIWATTWRAKLALSGGFFRLWIPTSLAAGTGLAALAVSTNGPPGTPGWVVPLLVAVAAISLTTALVATWQAEE